MKLTSFDEFVELARRATFVPVCKEIGADLLTPVSAFLKVAEHADYAFLLESVEGGEHVGRYSFLGKDPFLVLRSHGAGTLFEEAGVTTETAEPFLDALRRLMADYRAPTVPDLPRFTGGAVGYMAYDAVPWFEPTLARADAAPADPERGPAAEFMVFDTILAFDHVRHRIQIIANARIGPEDDLHAQYQFARARIQFLERELDRGLSRPAHASGAELRVSSNVTREEFEHSVRAAQRHIAAGDVFQVVLSQRFETPISADPFSVYRALRHINPSPYMFFLRAGALSIAGSSPEMLVRVEGQHVETHPIAGTRPRGRTSEEDTRLAAELLANEKERAEHVMLVDLGRNDLGRVSEYGSVDVAQFMAVERYSHVMHLVSTVRGRLARPHDRLDALVSCFPAGTVSGAPKVRAMEIIAQLESTARGLYAGAVGYVDFAGNLDFCITIRTIVIRDGNAVVQVGAGIVADSDPAAEFDETWDKAGALMQALQLAQTGW
jgi:anthranilate synthase component I